MRQVVTLSVALAVSLVGSYLTWTADDEVAVEGAPLYSASAADISKLEWRSDKRDVVMEARKDARGDHHWVTVTTRKEVPVQDEVASAVPTDASDADPPEEPEEAVGQAEEAAEKQTVTEETTKQFLANASAAETWTAFAPLHALRELGAASSMDLSALGFDEPTATLVVHRRSGALELVLGGQTYGSKDYYARLGDKVYLVDDATVRPLQFADQRLMERSLHPLEEKEIERVSVTDGARGIELVQQNRDDRAKAFWARSETPDTADDGAATWLGKLMRLRLTEYVDEASLAGPPERVFAVTITGKGGTWSAELLRVAGEGTQEEWFARSEHNRGLVRVIRSVAADIAADLDGILTE